MRKLLVCLFFIALNAVPAHARITSPPDLREVPGARFEYAAAQRLIRLSDGSDFVIDSRPWPKEPSATDAIFVSARGRAYDMVFAVNLWIPAQVADGTRGQIYSAAMSDDHDWIAVVGGWMGKEDHRGHNGIFILHRQMPAPGAEFWKLKLWFDVRGMTIGEVEFGPGDTLLTTSHDHDDSPIITAFTFAGQKIGSFVDAGKHSGSACREMRIQKLDSSSLAVYDPEASSVRFLTVSSKGDTIDVQQARTVPAVFPERRSYPLAFVVLPDGRIAIARTIADEQRRGQTLVSVLSPNGDVIEQWSSPRVWRYAYADGRTLNGIYPTAPDDERPVIRSVAIE